jgi:hypothetical protein
MKKIAMIIAASFSLSASAEAAGPEPFFACPTSADLIAALETSLTTLKDSLSQHAKTRTGLKGVQAQAAETAIKSGKLNLNISIKQERNADGCIYTVQGNPTIFTFKYQ